MLIFKVFRRPEWDELARLGHTQGAPVDRRDGFVHFSTAQQLPGTLEKHFAGETGLVLLAIEVGANERWLKWEASRGGERFPHLYRDLELTDVLWNRELPADPAEWALPTEPTCA